MEARETRRLNLLALIQEYGQQALADRLGMSKSQLSSLKTGVDDMGPVIARRIEKELGKTRGWMDVEHPSERESLTKALGGLWPKLSEEQRASLIHIAEMLARGKNRP